MDTIKTAVIVALLLAVLYGVYVVLNKETVGPPIDVAELAGDDDFLAPPDIDAGFAGERLADSSGSTQAPRMVKSGDDEEVVRNPRANRSDDDDSGASDGAESSYIQPPRKPPVDTFQASQFSEGSTYSPAARDGVIAESEYAHDGENDEDVELDEAALRDKDVEGVSYEPKDSAESSAPPVHGGPRYQDSSAKPPSGNATIAPTRFSSVKRDAEAHLAAKRYRSALATLSSAYGDPVLTQEENDTLLRMLDPLAGKVIYSREHLLEPSYLVRGEETLMEIAERYQVPWQLLQNVNGIRDPRVMRAGTELKVIRGPFRAEISLDGSEMTLFLDQLYAGRFPVTIGDEPHPEIGDFSVNAKEPGKTYYAEDGRQISADSPENPYGSVWIDLGADNLSIHGSPQQDAISGAGCIGLSPRDARDVFGILSLGSRVTIIR